MLARRISSVIVALAGAGLLVLLVAGHVVDASSVDVVQRGSGASLETEPAVSLTQDDPELPPVVEEESVAEVRTVPVRRYRISAVFEQPGPHTGGVHGGVDFATKEGRRVVSVSPGKVVEAKWLGNAGLAVVIRMSTGHRVLYGHLSRIDIRKGAIVHVGQQIGLVGSTGNSTGPHLHLQVNRPNGKAVDPLKALDMDLRQVKRAGRT